MPSLEAVVHLGESLLQTIDGREFYGAVMPVLEGSIPSYDFTKPRSFLHVPPDSLVRAGDIIVDVFSRHFLAADHDSGFISGVQLSKTLRLYNLDRQVSWVRTVKTQDPLTHLQTSNTAGVELGPIWVTPEFISREDVDLTFRIKQQSYYIMTNVALMLNDKVDGKIVKRVDATLGVYRAEIE